MMGFIVTFSYIVLCPLPSLSSLLFHSSPHPSKNPPSAKAFTDNVDQWPETRSPHGKWGGTVTKAQPSPRGSVAWWPSGTGNRFHWGLLMGCDPGSNPYMTLWLSKHCRGYYTSLHSLSCTYVMKYVWVT